MTDELINQRMAILDSGYRGHTIRPNYPKDRTAVNRALDTFTREETERYFDLMNDETHSSMDFPRQLYRNVIGASLRIKCKCILTVQHMWT